MKKILILSLFLTYSLQAFSDNLSDSNKLFNWAEKNYAHYFSPPGAITFKIENYLVRYYKDKNVYIGTLGEEVYIYGDIFNGLNRVGLMGDYIDVESSTDTPTVTYNGIKIVGSDTFITQTKAALDELKKLAPAAFNKTKQYIGIIEQADYSHIWASEEPPRYAVDDAESFRSIKWYAGAMAHEATHSELYHDYQAKHGLPVPADIWSSDAAEKFCIRYQIEVMKEMSAPQSDIDFLTDELNGANCDTDGNC